MPSRAIPKVTAVNYKAMVVVAVAMSGASLSRVSVFGGEDTPALQLACRA